MKNLEKNLEKYESMREATPREIRKLQEAIDEMRQRDCLSNIREGKAQVRGLMASAQNGGRTVSLDGNRMGSYKLEMIRGNNNKKEVFETPADLVQKQITLVDEYINGYSEKLSLQRDTNEDGAPKKVRLDKVHFERFVHLSAKHDFNPYLNYLKLKKETKNSHI